MSEHKHQGSTGYNHSTRRHQPTQLDAPILGPGAKFGHPGARSCWMDMGVSINGGMPKMVGLWWKIPSRNGWFGRYPYFRKPPYGEENWLVAELVTNGMGKKLKMLSPAFNVELCCNRCTLHVLRGYYLVLGVSLIQSPWRWLMILPTPYLSTLHILGTNIHE